jgi:hypothetical protein
MSDAKTDDLKTGTFDTWAKIEQRKAMNATVTVKVDDKAAVRQKIIAEIRRAKVEFVTRSDWKAREAKAAGLTEDWSYFGIALHHAGNSYTCDANGADKMRRVQQAHFAEGFDDIGYHFGVDCEGAIYEGRDIRFSGSHVLNQNKGLIGIVLLADLSLRGEEREVQSDLPFWKKARFGILPTYDDIAVRHDEPSEGQLKSLEKLVDVLKTNFRSIARFGGHREWAKLKDDARSCPGAHGLIVAEMMRKKFLLGQP